MLLIVIFYSCPVRDDIRIRVWAMGCRNTEEKSLQCFLYSYNCVLCLFLAHDIIIVLKIFESVLVFIMVEPNSVFISYLLFIGLFGLLVMIIWRIFVFILGLIKKIQSKRQQKQACLEVQSILKESGYLRVIGDCFKNIRTVESGHFCYDFVELATKNNVESFQITNNFYKYLQKHFGVMLSKEQACRLTDVTLTVYDLCDDSTYPEYAFMFVEEVLPSFTLVESKMDTPQSRRDSLHYTIRFTPEYTKLLIKQTK